MAMIIATTMTTTTSKYPTTNEKKLYKWKFSDDGGGSGE